MQKPISLEIDTTTGGTKILDKNITQGDTLKFTIRVYQGTQSLDLTGQTIHIVVKRSSGYSVEMKTGNPFLSVSGNVVTAIFKDEYLCTDVKGDTNGQIILIDSNGESSTNYFNFEVEESLAADVAVKTANKLDSLIAIEETIENYNANADHLEEQNNLAIQNKADLTDLNATSGNLANRLETDITNGTNAAIRLENDTATGNQLHSNLQQDFNTGGVLHNNLLADIANGNYTIAQLQGLNWSYIQSMLNLLELSFKGSRLTDGNGNYLTDGNGNYLTM
ncbi:BppU family phage baseplate upper protein [Clostridium beijerinckii]|uniref:BppU family phage baseplate upper protein n=1 Tax=Clostridium beijerinckii TaxID=1520 RepID=UPI001F31B8FB|nr:BppU family phage baseplate upper protein [Clostridium beijerinckii]